MTIDYTGMFFSGEEYEEMQEYVDLLTEIVHRTSQYDNTDEEFEIDCEINDNCRASVSAAIYSFYNSSGEALDAWIAAHPEVAHWVSHVACNSQPINFPELDNYIFNYDESEEAA